MKIRIQFSKHGVVKFIGHLDIMRYFQKAMRRWVLILHTRRFQSPSDHVFCCTVRCRDGERRGIYGHRSTFSSRASAMQEALNAVMADGIRILSVRALPDKTPNAMASVAAAGYLVRFRDGYVPDFLNKDTLDAFLRKVPYSFLKKTKKESICWI